MIKFPTVLILGAGASRPYGFPLANELRLEVIELIQEPDKPGLAKLLLECGFSAELIRDFREALAGSQAYSIDAFLEYRPGFSDIGKTAIAARLLPREVPKRLTIKDSWYQYLFHHMKASFEDFN